MRSFLCYLTLHQAVVKEVTGHIRPPEGSVRYNKGRVHLL